ncbi:hypothetical protein IAD21_00187 [Abditibacteriota bacterium]|nr:hypothetical protein IAD21_00187 [Abditibacteriota bacterium]
MENFFSSDTLNRQNQKNLNYFSRCYMVGSLRLAQLSLAKRALRGFPEESDASEGVMSASLALDERFSSRHDYLGVHRVPTASG